MAYEFERTDNSARRNQFTRITTIDGSLSRAAFASAGALSQRSWMLDDDFSKGSGKWVWECSFLRYTTSTVQLGFGAEAEMPTSGQYASSNKNAVIHYPDLKLYYNGGVAATGVVPTLASTTTYVVTFYLDADTRKMWVASDGVIASGGDPSADTSPTYTVPGTHDLEPIFTIGQNFDGQILLHDPGKIIYPEDGFTPYGFVPATITFASGAIKDNAGASVTESDVDYDVFSAAGIWLASGTVSISAGAATLNFDADVADADKVRVVFSKWDGLTLGENFNYGMEAVAVSV